MFRGGGVATVCVTQMMCMSVWEGMTVSRVPVIEGKGMRLRLCVCDRETDRQTDVSVLMCVCR